MKNYFLAIFVFFSMIFLFSCSNSQDSTNDFSFSNRTLKNRATFLEGDIDWTEELEGEILSRDAAIVYGIDSKRVSLTLKSFLASNAAEVLPIFPDLKGLGSLDFREFSEDAKKTAFDFCQKLCDFSNCDDFFEADSRFILSLFFADLVENWSENFLEDFPFLNDENSTQKNQSENLESKNSTQENSAKDQNPENAQNPTAENFEEAQENSTQKIDQKKLFSSFILAAPIFFKSNIIEENAQNLSENQNQQNPNEPNQEKSKNLKSENQSEDENSLESLEKSKPENENSEKKLGKENFEQNLQNENSKISEENLSEKKLSEKNEINFENSEFDLQKNPNEKSQIQIVTSEIENENQKTKIESEKNLEKKFYGMCVRFFVDETFPKKSLDTEISLVEKNGKWKIDGIKILSWNSTNSAQKSEEK